jgi:AcrR family transcriptional regulator
MEDKEDKKDYILRKAFDLFLNQGYDSVSMTVLHRELNISRGAIYCYFEGKDALFIATIDRYYFGFIERVRPKLSSDLTLRERIDQYYSHIDELRRFYNLKKNDYFFLKYAALMIQAVKIYPNFLTRWRQIQEQEYRGWEESILKSIEKGEVRADVKAKVMTKVFVRLVDFFNSDTDELSNNTVFSDNSSNMLEQANYIFSLIKV